MMVIFGVSVRNVVDLNLIIYVGGTVDSVKKISACISFYLVMALSETIATRLLSFKRNMIIFIYMLDYS